MQLARLLLFTVFACAVFGQDSITVGVEQETTDIWTTNYGAPVQDNDHSLTVGVNGPTLLSDYVLLEKLANFDRERIPERVVHAVGASAKGFFNVTADVSKYTFAKFLQPNKITPTIVRFSTVIPSRGGPETVRDPRGFAVKFYTEQGNYDLVGNNFPVFFIRDGMKFPDMVHSLKPNPITNQQEWWRTWDFFSSHPESMHMFTFLLDDMGIPADFRHMDGAGVHTFRWISATGSELYVKYTWESHQGIENLETEEEVKNITNPAHATLDLYESIQNGDFPKWSLMVQLLDPKRINDFDFDPLDPTKIWPTDLIPAMEVGVLVLNETIDNFFAENELLAFAPSNVVPGIDYSEDKLLQARLFSYPDTQRYRIGSNYLLLPVNVPRCPFQNHNYDGVMNFGVPQSAINYFPSRLNNIQNAPAYPTDSTPQAGRPTRGSIAKTNDFKQPGDRYRSFDNARRQRFIARLIDSLKDPKLTTGIRSIIISYWTQVDNITLGPALRAAFPGGKVAMCGENSH